MPRLSVFNLQLGLTEKVPLEIEKEDSTPNTCTRERSYIRQVSSLSLSSSLLFLILFDRSVSDLFFRASLWQSERSSFMFKTLLKFLLLLRWSLFWSCCLCGRINLLRPNYQPVTCAIPLTTARFLLTWRHYLYYYKKEHKRHTSFKF